MKARRPLVFVVLAENLSRQGTPVGACKSKVRDLVFSSKPSLPALSAGQGYKTLDTGHLESGARVIARRDARGPHAAARMCCMRTASTGRKEVFLGYFFAPAKKVTRGLQPRKLLLESYWLLPISKKLSDGRRTAEALDLTTINTI